MYTPENPIYYIKVGFKGVSIISVCFRDAIYGRNTALAPAVVVVIRF